MAASQHAPTEAFAYAKAMIKSSNLDPVEAEILDEAAKMIWYAAPWSWTVGEISPIVLVASQADYTISPPSDLAYIYRARLVDSDKVHKELRVESYLPADSVKTGEIISISYLDQLSKIRVFPKPPANLPSAQQKILLFYKKSLPNITSANKGTINQHQLDDRWWHVYKNAVLLLAYQFIHDERAGSVQVDPVSGQARLLGQLAYVEYLLNEMRRREPLHSEWEIRMEARTDRR
ncbi:MAG: hypothetical protein V2G41_09640 [bacterium JZ-2024 1]